MSGSDTRQRLAALAVALGNVRLLAEWVPFSGRSRSLYVLRVEDSRGRRYRAEFDREGSVASVYEEVGEERLRELRRVARLGQDAGELLAAVDPDEVQSALLAAEDREALARDNGYSRSRAGRIGAAARDVGLLGGLARRVEFYGR